MMMMKMRMMIIRGFSIGICRGYEMWYSIMRRLSLIVSLSNTVRAGVLARLLEIEIGRARTLCLESYIIHRVIMYIVK
jgi:hypothetical protein